MQSVVVAVLTNGGVSYGVAASQVVQWFATLSTLPVVAIRGRQSLPSLPSLTTDDDDSGDHGDSAPLFDDALAAAAAIAHALRTTSVLLRCDCVVAMGTGEPLRL